MKDLIRAHAGLLFAGLASFVMMGAGQSLYGPALPAFSRSLAISEAQAGVLVSAHWVGCFIGVALMYLRGTGITPRRALGAMALGAAGVAAMMFFVALGAPAGLSFPGFYVTATGKMGEDIRVPPTIIASGLAGGIGGPLVLAPLMAGMGGRGFFWILAGVTLLLTVAAVLSLRRMRA